VLVVRVMNPWVRDTPSVTGVVVAQPVRLVDIMSEQVIAEFFPPATAEKVQPSDYEIALRLQQQENESFAERIDEDLAFAQFLQSQEDDSQRRRPDDSLSFSKIVTRSAFATDDSNVVSGCRPFVGSSSYAQAVQQDRKVEHLSQTHYQHLVKHDSLLSALSNSESLSELNGVGDLTGQGLIVNKSVAQPLRTFIRKQSQLVASGKKKQQH
jgi:hypothetical protein